MMLTKLVCLILPALVLSLETPKDLTQETYCLGCQTVVKELDFTLSQKPTRGVGETVSRTLKQVCHENNFKKYELGYKTSMKACKHIKDDKGLESILVSEYSRLHELGIKSSYVDIAKKICGSYLNACLNPEYLTPGEDGGIEYNPETQEFSIKHGKKVKVARSGTKQTEETPSVEDNRTPTPDPINLGAPDVHSPEGHDEL